ncbi:hypothetical protein GE061_002739 [Apolygus lucorum]|uniref:Uncharacterized protein n=1 Tax=Apolygus lucorum TaxID=248454 RepID=A0A8S9X7S1_APOLU|nr:hypothetical protein GE061_002739 [Apolygus lucorum]
MIVVQLLWVPPSQSSSVCFVSEALHENPDCRWNEIVMAMNAAAESTVGIKKNERNGEWFDQDCAKLIEEKNRARDRMQARETRQTREEYRTKRRAADKMCRLRKKQADKHKVAMIEQMSEERRLKDMYREVKWFSHGFQPRVSGCKSKDGRILGEESEILNRRTEYFEELLNKDNDAQEDSISDFVDPSSYRPSEQLCTDPPSQQEVLVKLCDPKRVFASAYLSSTIDGHRGFPKPFKEEGFHKKKKSEEDYSMFVKLCFLLLDNKRRISAWQSESHRKASNKTMERRIC